MPHQEIDGVPIWYEEHGDPDGRRSSLSTVGSSPSTAASATCCRGSREGRRVIGVELQGHGHTPDTGRPISIERFADDVAGSWTEWPAADRPTSGASASAL